jgi:hypothetical protein
MIASVLNRPPDEDQLQTRRGRRRGKLSELTQRSRAAADGGVAHHFIEFLTWLLNQLREAIEGSAQG